jgi:hypothetical protein
VSNFDEYVVSDHAKQEMDRRSISMDEVQAILRSPEQKIESHSSRIVLQSKITRNETIFLIRVIIDTEKTPKRVITVYRTSKIDKYWRPS